MSNMDRIGGIGYRCIGGAALHGIDGCGASGGDAGDRASGGVDGDGGSIRRVPEYTLRIGGGAGVVGVYLKLCGGQRLAGGYIAHYTAGEGFGEGYSVSRLSLSG